MRCYSVFNTDTAELHEELEGPEFLLVDFLEYYKDRAWDLCEADGDVMAEMAGISFRGLDAALRSLENKGMIESNEFGWLTLLRPRHTYKPDFMNGLQAKTEIT